MDKTPQPTAEPVGAGAGAGRPASTTTTSSRPSSSQDSRPVDFDPERCGALFRECATCLHDIPIEPFLSACDEIKKLIGAPRERGGAGKADPAIGSHGSSDPLRHSALTLSPPSHLPASVDPAATLGTALGIASSDIAEKVGVIQLR